MSRRRGMLQVLRIVFQYMEGKIYHLRTHSYVKKSLPPIPSILESVERNIQQLLKIY